MGNYKRYAVVFSRSGKIINTYHSWLQAIGYLNKDNIIVDLQTGRTFK